MWREHAKAKAHICAIYVNFWEIIIAFPIGSQLASFSKVEVTFGHPLEKFLWLPVEKSANGPSLKKSFRRPWQPYSRTEFQNYKNKNLRYSKATVDTANKDK